MRYYCFEKGLFRLCRGDNTFRHLKSVEKRFNATKMNGWSFSMITRDPIDRFVSGYVDRCIRFVASKNFDVSLSLFRVAEGPSPCNGCDKNMTCFILSEYERFKKQATKGVLTNTFEDRHFYPQNWWGPWIIDVSPWFETVNRKKETFWALKKREVFQEMWHWDNERQVWVHTVF